jgi:hypothetical protein
LGACEYCAGNRVTIARLGHSSMPESRNASFHGCSHLPLPAHGATSVHTQASAGTLRMAYQQALSSVQKKYEGRLAATHMQQRAHMSQAWACACSEEGGQQASENSTLHMQLEKLQRDNAQLVVCPSRRTRCTCMPRLRTHSGRVTRWQDMGSVAASSLMWTHAAVVS